MTNQIRQSARGLRLGTLAWFSPKKLGSGEGAAMAFAESARKRGHNWTLFCFEPIHPVFATALKDAGADLVSLSKLQERPIRTWRMFATEFDVLELNLMAPRSSLALAAYLAWPCSVVFIDRVSGPSRPEETEQHWASRFLDRYTMMPVRAYVGVSEYVRRRGQQRFHMRREKTHVIYNGIDTARFHPLDSVQERTVRGAEVTILAVGTLIQEKGMDILLRALARSRFKNWRLKVVGEGPEAEPLRTLAQDLGIRGRTQFLGLRDDVDKLMREADIFVHPAVWAEAFGMTVVEGMASGCCVLASRVGGIPELMEDRVEGVLLEPGEISAWADAITRYCEDGVARQEMGVAARRRVLRDFTMQRRIDKEITLLESVARRQ